MNNTADMTILVAVCGAVLAAVFVVAGLAWWLL